MQAIPPASGLYTTLSCYPNAGARSFDESTVLKASEDLRANLKTTVSGENGGGSSIPDGETVEDRNKEVQDEKERIGAAADDDGDDDDDFYFACGGALKSPISADDAFLNGQIKPIFPFFAQNLILGDQGLESSGNRLPLRPPVDKIFIETDDSGVTSPLPPPSSSLSESGNVDEEAAGPYCSWSKKAVEASPEICKKSNSTGFSKFWRFRDLLNRSNSDGRDAFVFLNNSTTQTAAVKKDEKVVEKSHVPSSSTKKKVTAGEPKVKVAGEKAKGKKAAKSETKSFSAHEKYMKNKASSESDRRRSYLPYKPELVGFFTNVNGGLSRNVHPF